MAGLLDQVDHLCPAHKEIKVPKSSLFQAVEAFNQIKVDTVKSEVVENQFVYHFKEFDVVTSVYKTSFSNPEPNFWCKFEQTGHIILVVNLMEDCQYKSWLF